MRHDDRDHARLAVFPVTGPPGAGKTTVLLWLEQRYPSVARFGVRDYGLQLAAAGDPLGSELRDTLLRQELLSDELVMRELRHFLDRLAPSVRCLAVEGYPRNRRQCNDLANAVEQHGGWVAACIVVDLPDALVRNRVAGRRVCRRCGLPAHRGGGSACGHCGGAMVLRGDDLATRLDRRLADYRAASVEVREHFAERGRLRLIDGARAPEAVRADLEAMLCGTDRGVGSVDRDPSGRT